MPPRFGVTLDREKGPVGFSSLERGRHPTEASQVGANPWRSAGSTVASYGLADLCTPEGRPFVLGHARSMQAIPGGKAKHDTIDAQKLAVWRRWGPHASAAHTGGAAGPYSPSQPPGEPARDRPDTRLHSEPGGRG